MIELKNVGKKEVRKKRKEEYMGRNKIKEDPLCHAFRTRKN